MDIKIKGCERLEEIAVGDLARVLRAWSVPRRREVVIKVFHPDVLPDGVNREIFLAEMQKLTALEHPELVATFEAGVKSDGRTYCVQEYVDGHSVDELLAGGKPLKEAHALLFARCVALALQYAWREARLLHGHLKPDNLMVDAHRQVKVADLGLARLIGVAARAPAATGRRTTLRGTTHYVSPEQARGETELDARSDVYSLGAVLYHMATGRRPFDEAADAAAAACHLDGVLPDPREIAPGLSAPAAALIAKLMVRDRAERCGDWDEVLADLEAVRQGRPPSDPTPARGASTIALRDGPAAAGEVPPPVFAAKPAAKRPTRRTVRAGVRPAAKGNGKGNGNGRRVVKAPAGSAGPKPRIVIPTDLDRQLRGRRPRRKPSGGRVVFTLIVLAVAAYAGYRWREASRAAARGSRTPSGTNRMPRAQVVGTFRGQRWTGDLNDLDTSGVPARAATRTEPAESRPRPRPTPPAPPVVQPVQNGQHRHPAFRRGARGFNAALALFKQYQADKQQPGLLQRIESLGNQAARDFEEYKAAVPGDPQAERYIEQCYGIVRYARQCMLSDHGTGGTRAATPPRARNNVERFREQLRSSEGRPLQLAPGWNAGPTGAPDVRRDLLALLGPRGHPQMDLRPDPALVLYARIGYLADAATVAASIGQSLPEPREFTGPGYPEHSFQFYDLSGTFSGRFSRMRLVTDRSARVVAVQLLAEGPADELLLPSVLFDDRWSAYDLLEGRVRDGADQRIAHRVREEGGVLRIESELAEHREGTVGQVGRSLVRTQLCLPQPIVDLLLVRLMSSR